MSKIEAGKFELSRGELDLERMLMNITNVANIRAEEKQQNFIVNLDYDVPPFIISDELRLSQVIANLISNANRYTNGGEITISADKKDDNVVITVSDNGTGIPADLLPHVFKRGVSDRGTGLGLHICKVIVEEEHKGEIFVKSSPVGTVFTITLPVYKGN